MRKRIRGLCVVFVGLLLFNSPVMGKSINENAEIEGSGESLVLPVGDLIPVQGIEEDVSDWEVRYDCDEIERGIERRNNNTLEDVNIEGEVAYQIKDAAVYNNEWDRYANNYVYNELSDEKKIVWEAMDALCLEALSQKTDYTGNIGAVASSAFDSSSDLADFLSIYKYSNPQYFFLSHGYSYGVNSNGKYYVNWAIYNNMKNGEARAEAVEKFKAGIESFKEDITYSASDEYATVKSIHDTVCNKTTYDNASVGTGHANEQTEYTQSAYSTFVRKTTVCAGYAMATELLCNDAGIDCMSVTSEGHAWNVVRVYDSWYHMDTTWGDQDSGIYYGYFLKSTANYASNASHVIESTWNGYVPSCTLNSVNSNGDWQVGTISKPTLKVETPKVSVGDKVTLSTDTADATIYYTLDGTQPSCSYTRSFKYKAPFSVPENGRVKAIAAKDTYEDSDVKDAILKRITYNLNDGTNSASNPACFVVEDGKTIQLANPSRAGYLFKGWYTSADFKTGTKIQEIDCSLNQNYTLYAKWIVDCIVTGNHKLESQINSEITNQLVSEATCTTPAVYKKYCSACGVLSEETFEYGEALGHAYVPNFNWEADGSECSITLICSRNESHTINENCIVTSGVKKAPTCKEKGITTYTAIYYLNDVRYQSEKDIENLDIDLSAHVWNEGEITTQATANTVGIRTYLCEICGETKTEEIPKLPDNPETPAPEIPDTPANDGSQTPTVNPMIGMYVEDIGSNTTYVVTGTSRGVCEVTFFGGNSTSKTVTIPNTVTVNGVNYEITGIGTNAFKSAKKATGIVVGKNIVTIAKGAFNGCKKVKTIVIRSKKLTAKTVAKNAFKGIKKGTVIKVPKNKVSVYRKLFQKKGLDRKVKVKAY